MIITLLIIEFDYNYGDGVCARYGLVFVVGWAESSAGQCTTVHATVTVGNCQRPLLTNFKFTFY